jgi:hypothetical protein
MAIEMLLKWHKYKLHFAIIFQPHILASTNYRNNFKPVGTKAWDSTGQDSHVSVAWKTHGLISVGCTGSVFHQYHTGQHMLTHRSNLPSAKWITSQDLWDNVFHNDR